MQCIVQLLANAQDTNSSHDAHSDYVVEMHGSIDVGSCH
jgi:hypothetical protein